MDEPIYLGFAVLELSKLLMYETFYDKVQPYFGEKNKQCLYMDSDTKSTPIIMKVWVGENINKEDWYQGNNVIIQWGNKEIVDCAGFQAWTCEGRKSIKKTVGHMREKKL